MPYPHSPSQKRSAPSSNTIHRDTRERMQEEDPWWLVEYGGRQHPPQSFEPEQSKNRSSSNSKYAHKPNYLRFAPAAAYQRADFPDPFSAVGGGPFSRLHAIAEASLQQGAL